MENNGYGQLRQDVGKLIAVGDRLEEGLKRHEEDDERKFDQHNTRLTFIEKMMWITTGAVGILGIGTVAQLFKDFLIR